MWKWRLWRVTIDIDKLLGFQFYCATETSHISLTLNIVSLVAVQLEETLGRVTTTTTEASVEDPLGVDHFSAVVVEEEEEEDMLELEDVEVAAEAGRRKERPRRK